MDWPGPVSGGAWSNSGLVCRTLRGNKNIKVFFNFNEELSKSPNFLYKELNDKE